MPVLICSKKKCHRNQVNAKYFHPSKHLSDKYPNFEVMRAQLVMLKGCTVVGNEERTIRGVRHGAFGQNLELQLDFRHALVMELINNSYLKEDEEKEHRSKRIKLINDGHQLMTVRSSVL